MLQMPIRLQLHCQHLSSCACIGCLHLINPIYLSLHQRSSSLASLLLRVTFYRLKDGENFNDTEETIQKRIKTFNEETRPIIGDSSKFLATVSLLQILVIPVYKGYAICHFQTVSVCPLLSVDCYQLISRYQYSLI